MNIHIYIYIHVYIYTYIYIYIYIYTKFFFSQVFEEYLLDADPALNYGNWMWLSCSCFFYQYFRCYSPVAFPKKYDKNGDYVRKWLPQLAKLPAKYIYEPWKASAAELRAAGCELGVDYPHRIVIHEEISKANMGR